MAVIVIFCIVDVLIWFAIIDRTSADQGFLTARTGKRKGDTS